LITLAVHIGQTKIGYIVEIKLIRYPDAEVSDGKNSHEVSKPSQKKQICIGLEAALFNNVVVFQTTNVFQNSIEAFNDSN